MCFDRTYEELKHRCRQAAIDAKLGFDRTYEELKPRMDEEVFGVSKGFDRTYEELKHTPEQTAAISEDEF